MPLPQHASATPRKIATIMARSGESVTFGELDDRSRRLANVWREAGLRSGDVVALFMENNIRYHEVYWAAVRSGMLRVRKRLGRMPSISRRRPRIVLAYLVWATSSRVWFMKASTPA